MTIIRELPGKLLTFTMILIGIGMVLLIAVVCGVIDLFSTNDRKEGKQP